MIAEKLDGAAGPGCALALELQISVEPRSTGQRLCAYASSPASLVLVLLPDRHDHLA